jgi:hypothetical protein
MKEYWIRMESYHYKLSIAALESLSLLPFPILSVTRAWVSHLLFVLKTPSGPQWILFLGGSQSLLGHLCFQASFPSFEPFYMLLKPLNSLGALLGLQLLSSGKKEIP